ncbi:hypothetical protein, partial [Anaerotruncus colihominis]|uniref:hypothetical protein n=1 Tax=Anaerotruncus colihominis TaxID=169435 RepID=UPI0026EF6ED2
ITALRLLYHVREAAWYNCPSKSGCRVSGEPLGITRYNNRSAVIIQRNPSKFNLKGNLWIILQISKMNAVKTIFLYTT